MLANRFEFDDCILGIGLIYIILDTCRCRFGRRSLARPGSREGGLALDNHPIEGLMKTALESIKQMVDVNTVVEDTLHYQNASLRPQAKR